MADFGVPYQAMQLVEQCHGVRFVAVFRRQSRLKAVLLRVVDDHEITASCNGRNSIHHHFNAWLLVFVPGRSEFQAASLAGEGGPEEFVSPSKVTCFCGIAFPWGQKEQSCRRPRILIVGYGRGKGSVT